MSQQMQSFIAGWIQDSINVVGIEETVALLWDQYLSEWPADPDIERALSVLDPNWTN